jgi:hypothetical protein
MQGCEIELYLMEQCACTLENEEQGVAMDLDGWRERVGWIEQAREVAQRLLDLSERLRQTSALAGANIDLFAQEHISVGKRFPGDPSKIFLLLLNFLAEGEL